MRLIGKIGLLSVVYAFSLIGGYASLCLGGVLRCRIGDGLTLSMATFPLSIAFSILILVGVFVASIIYVLDAYLVRSQASYPTLKRIAGGMLAGLLPSALWSMASGSVSEILYLRVDYIPFIVGGLLVAILCPVLRERGKTHS